jgi:hypothetical protein
MSLTYVTLQYGAQELTLADWGRQAGGALLSWKWNWKNQLKDNLSLTFACPFDGNYLFPFGGNVTLRLGRVPAPGFIPSPALNPNPGLPVTGCSQWSGGQVVFTGYRVKPSGRAAPQTETVTYSFAGIWEYFFDNTKYQKVLLTWDGTKQVADYFDEFVLGVSLNTLFGPNDTVPGTLVTNYMSIAQEVKSIMAFAANASALDFAAGALPQATDYAAVAGTYTFGVSSGTNGIPSGAQFQFDQNSMDGPSGDYFLSPSPSANALIPDFYAGYGASIPGSPTRNSAAAQSMILRAPNNAVNNIMCSDALREMLKWIGGLGGVSVWWDYTTSPPTARFATRDQLPAKALALAPGSGVTLNAAVEPRDDLVPAAIHFKYVVSGTLGGFQYQQVLHDISFFSEPDNAVIEGVGTWGALKNLAGATWDSTHQAAFKAAYLRSHTVGGTFNYAGLSSTNLSGKVNSAAFDGGTAAWWANVCPKLANAVANGSLAFNAAGPGANFTVLDAGTSGLANGTTYPIADLPAYGYYLLPGSGGVSPWMNVGNNPANAAAEYISVKFRVQFTYSEQITPPPGATAVPTAAKTDEIDVNLVLTNLAAGNYQSVPEFIAGEPIPYGLAGYLFDLMQIEQWEGSVSIEQADLTNLVPPGFNLNLTGGKAAWASMNAQVQEITLEGDADSARATYGFGPARHLGAADLNELLRVNHGPRWSALFGGNPLNVSSPGGSGSLPDGNASAGAAGGTGQAQTYQLTPSNLAALQATTTSFVLPPGLISYGKGAGPTGSYSGIGGGPGLAAGDGTVTSGAYTADTGIGFRVDLADLIAILEADGQTGIAKFIRLPYCYNGSNNYAIAVLAFGPFPHTW